MTSWKLAGNRVFGTVQSGLRAKHTQNTYSTVDEAEGAPRDLSLARLICRRRASLTPWGAGSDAINSQDERQRENHNNTTGNEATDLLGSLAVHIRIPGGDMSYPHWPDAFGT